MIFFIIKVLFYIFYQRSGKVCGELAGYLPPRAGADPVPRVCAHVPRAGLQPARGRGQAVRREVWLSAGVLLSGGHQEVVLCHPEGAHEGQRADGQLQHEPVHGADVQGYLHTTQVTNKTVCTRPDLYRISVIGSL